MSTSTIRRVAALASLALIAPIGVGIAMADTLQTDGDDQIDSNGVIAFGNICVGQEMTKPAALAVKRQSNTNSGSVFKNGALVSFDTPTVTGASNVSPATPPSIQLYNDWETRAANGSVSSDIVHANVVVTAGSVAAPSQSAKIAYRVTGQRSSGGTLTLDDTLDVTWGVVICNTAPVVTITSPLNGESIEGDVLGGANVTIQATASDVQDGSLTPTCTASSGVFAVGPHSFSCSVTDSGGLSGSANVSFTVVDTTPPSLSALGDITAEATSAAGATVTYSATATDIVDGPITPDCTPSSGSTFPLGTTTVTCTATDNAGNSASAIFDVTVQDTTAPSVSVPPDITAEATSAAGATVTYSATATDIVDGPITPDCTPSSGSTFALGTNAVTCTATDDAGNSASASFNVTVQDTTAPAISVPADFTVDPSGISGAVVNYGMVWASDAVDGTFAASCSPASGTTFGFGTTKVTCNATDNAGNAATKFFNVTVSALTLHGFYSPVDGNGIWNTVKNGSTVPLKFRVFAGTTELTDIAAIKSFTQKVVSCAGGNGEDAIEITSTGGTSLRYDATGGQFIQNWQTPKQVGKCYTVTMTTVDGSSITANFKLK